MAQRVLVTSHFAHLQSSPAHCYGKLKIYNLIDNRYAVLAAQNSSDVLFCTILQVVHRNTSGTQKESMKAPHTGGTLEFKQNTYSVPLSTICVRREMPSRFINSWANVTSRE